MKFTLAWLKQFLDTEATLEEISAALTSLGLEVEAIIDHTKALKDFIVARIVETQPHPTADKLQLCSVDTGKEMLQIVCGAPNARAEIKVVLAPVGSVIPRNNMQIKASTIRGIVSQGMLCSAWELGISEEHEGIIELPQDATPGDNVAPLMGLGDLVIEIEVTPNRGDCLGVYGIARDLAAKGVGTLKTLPKPKIESAFRSSITVSIISDAGCPLFIGRHFRAVANKASPSWLQQQLRSVGIQPISLLVDITNYIAYSFGRPLHVYDAAKIGSNIEVRLSKSGEICNALNDKAYILDDKTIVVAGEQGVLGIAGIIGGAESGCSDTTTDIFLESALFDPARVAQTGRKLSIDTDARYRFERGVDPEFTREGAEIASQMIIELCGGEASEWIVVGKYAACLPDKHVIPFRINKIAQLAGITLPLERITTILTALGFAFQQQGDVLIITVPSWRCDIEGEADIVEEIVRVYGYDALPIMLPPAPAAPSTIVLSPDGKRAGNIRRLLSTRGLMEIITWSFMEQAKSVLFGGGQAALTLQNPINASLSVMRPSLFPICSDALTLNSARGYKDIGLFEIGPAFYDITVEGEKQVASGIRAGNTAPRNHYKDSRTVDIFDVKGDVMAILKECGVKTESLTLTREAPGWYHPGRSGVLKLGTKTVLGYFGELHPSILNTLGIGELVVGFEVFLQHIPFVRSKQGAKGAPCFSDYPLVERDFAFIIDREKPVEEILHIIAAVEKECIKDVALFDVYQGQGIETGKKSIAVSVTLQAKDRTLASQEIEDISKNIILFVQQAGGVLRK